jgi:hypothetical protein
MENLASVSSESAESRGHYELEQTLEAIARSQHVRHPFQDCVNDENVLRVMRRYFAMSQAFPYLQAGAQKDHIFRCLENGVPINREVEITTVVGSFLVWDETGGNHILSTGGIPALPRILETGTNFHANLLSKDLRRMFNTDIEPAYTPETKEYLIRLFEGLANPDAVERCAWMVAFEMHAGRMIEALWESLSKLFDMPKDELTYFHIHVGGDDPAEPHHVAMTAKMIEALVPFEEQGRFLRSFERAYRANIEWCAAIAA